MVWNVQMSIENRHCSWTAGPWMQLRTTSEIHQEIIQPFVGDFFQCSVFWWAVIYQPKGHGGNESVCSQKRCSPTWITVPKLSPGKTTRWSESSAQPIPSQHWFQWDSTTLLDQERWVTVTRNDRGFIPALALAVIKGVNKWSPLCG